MRQCLVCGLIAAGLLLVPVSGQRAYDAFEQITVANTAIGFTTASIEPAGQPQAVTAQCRLRTAQISFTVDGTTPTSSVGTLWEVGEERRFHGHDVLVKFRSIRTGATSGQLDCTYWSQ